jgi:hypothetical protein
MTTPSTAGVILYGSVAAVPHAADATFIPTSSICLLSFSGNTYQSLMTGFGRNGETT